MKDGYILLLFVLGIFLVFTVSGQITGNPIFPSSDYTTKKEVLNMLNKCELRTGPTTSPYYNTKTCNQECSSIKKICILTQISVTENGDVTSKLQTCNIDFSVQYPNSYYGCVCCSP